DRSPETGLAFSFGVDSPPMDATSLTRDEAIHLVHSVEADIRQLGVGRLALFGSVIRDEARPDSDVDVLVEFIPSEKTFDRFMALADFSNLSSADELSS